MLELETALTLTLPRAPAAGVSVSQVARLWHAFPEALALRVELVARCFAFVVDHDAWHVLLDEIGDDERQELCVFTRARPKTRGRACVC